MSWLGSRNSHIVSSTSRQKKRSTGASLRPLQFSHGHIVAHNLACQKDNILTRQKGKYGIRPGRAFQSLLGHATCLVAPFSRCSAMRPAWSRLSVALGHASCASRVRRAISFRVSIPTISILSPHTIEGKCEAREGRKSCKPPWGPVWKASLVPSLAAPCPWNGALRVEGHNAKSPQCGLKSDLRRVGFTQQDQ